jgi:DNA polymerase III subunit gamma/tau
MSTPALFDNPENDVARGDAKPLEGATGGQADETSSKGTQSLYRKFRPQTFDASELVGQDAIVRTLRNAIQLDRVAHAYLFAGPRGTGKTTTARLLAKAVNCLTPDPSNRPCNACSACQAIASGSAIDVIEIDAASNRGIDDIRELRERVKFAPAQLRTKFYIIDEAHQITGAAANAFLKTLEEPPAHTRFVLATTDPEHILPTIVSRCQIFEFKRIALAATKRRVAHVAAEEGFEISDDALDLIARQAGGSLRDALGLMDQLASFRESGESRITADDVRELLGMSRDELIVQIVVAIAERDAATALGLLQESAERGADPRQVARQIVMFLRAIMHHLADPRSTADADVERVSSMFSLAESMREAQRFGELDFKVRHSSIPQLPLEIGIVAAVLREDSSVTVGAPGVQHQPRVAPAVPQPGPDPDRPVAAEPAEQEKRSTSLSERVRNSAATAQSVSATPGLAAGLGNGDAAGSEAGVKPVTTSAATSLTIDTVRSQWDQIRADVKARSRRVDALLVSVDPVAVQGDTIILASAYPFHRNKLSEPDVQAIVEEVIDRLTGQKVRVSTILHSEAPTLVASAELDSTSDPVTALQSSNAAVVGQDPAANGQLSEDDRRTLDAAKNIFDAEEIDY